MLYTSLKPNYLLTNCLSVLKKRGFDLFFRQVNMKGRRQAFALIEKIKQKYEINSGGQPLLLRDDVTTTVT